MTEATDNGMALEFEELKRRVLAFRDERDWKQFHDPKNLSEAISIEAGELMELFLWKGASESQAIGKANAERVAEEAADILIFLTYLSEEVGFDLLEAALAKVACNERKYPPDKARGKSDKYSEL